jgi:hypothetical protein
MPKPRDFTGQTIGDKKVLRLLLEPDKHGSRQWECKCIRIFETVDPETGEVGKVECGVIDVISAHYLAHECGTECTHKLRDLADIEKPGPNGELFQVFCADHSDYPRSTVEFWERLKTSDGQPLMKMGQKEEDDADFFWERVKIHDRKGVTIPKWIRLYKREALKRCRDRGKVDRAATRWKTMAEVIERNGVKFARWSYIRRVLSGEAENDDGRGLRLPPFTKSAYRDWETRGWPLLAHARPRCVIEHGVKYHALEQLKEAKRTLDSLPSRIPDNHPRLYSREETSRRTGIGERMLRSHDHCSKHMLEKDYLLVRITFTDEKGRELSLLQYVLGFTKTSVAACVERKKASEPRLATITLQNAFKHFRKASKRCTLSPAVVNQWCHENLVDALLEDLPQAKGPRENWNIAVAACPGGVAGFSEVMEILRTVGWDTSAATAKLREQRKERIMASCGQPLPSRFTATSELNGLVGKEAQAFDFIAANPRALGKNIAKAIGVSYIYFRQALVPVLKEHGVLNEGAGYYVG